MEKRQTLFSKLFISSLLVLLINDFALKWLYPGVITGKLSDFAGIIVFLIFFTWLFPEHKKSVYVFTIITFSWWKSPFSQNFIVIWNDNFFFSIDRTVDYSDLLSLLVVPFLYNYQPRQNEKFYLQKKSKQIFQIVLSMITIFSIFATSYINTLKYDQDSNPINKYELVGSPNKIITIINEELHFGKYQIDYGHTNDRVYQISLKYGKESYRFLEANFRLVDKGEITILELLSITIHEPPDDDKTIKDLYRKIFEEKCISVLKQHLN